jgi:SAM-dependent methyltransferase
VSPPESRREAGESTSLDEIADVWDGYYADAGVETALRDEQFFRLEMAALLDAIEVAARDRAQVHVLELGSGTGMLAAAISERLRGVGVRYLGIDLSGVACGRATARGLEGCEFRELDFLSFLEAGERTYDVIVSQRSLMGVLDGEAQRRIIGLLAAHLTDSGVALLSEATQQALTRVDELRRTLGLQPLETIWHSRALDEDVIRGAFGAVEVRDFASTYWLLTRVVYPFFQEPRHNTEFHTFAANLPQLGDFGYVRLFSGRSA